MHPYERWTLRCGLASALRSSRLARPPQPDSALFGWIQRYSRLLNLPQLACRSVSGDGQRSTPEQIRSAWNKWRVAAIRVANARRPNVSPLQKRLDRLALACALTDGQSRVLGLLARATHSSPLGNLLVALNSPFRTCIDGVAEADLRPFLETRSERQELSAVGQLAEIGLIDVHECIRLSSVADS
jgi:hypothetical protein